MDIIKNIRTYSLIEWLVFFVIIAHFPPWFMWRNGYSTLCQYAGVVLLLLIFIKRNRLKSASGFTIFLFFLLYFVVIQIFNNIHLSYILICAGYLIAANLRIKECTNVINLITNYVFLSILIPLPLWLFHQYVMPLPLYEILDISSIKGANGVFMENYFFFVTFSGTEAMRFYSWYDEPGVLGTLAPFILFANQFNMKDKRIPIIIVGCLFTFSMAFYILSLIGWLYINRHSLKSIILTLLSIVLISLLLCYFLQDNLAFQQSVIYRFTNFSETGVDSRNSFETNMIWNSMKSTGDLIFGLGSGAMNNYGGISSSYKSFIIEFGYVGCFLLLTAYYKLLRYKNLLGIFTLFLFSLSFLQRPQLFTAGWFLLYSCVIGYLSYANQNITRK